MSKKQNIDKVALSSGNNVTVQNNKEILVNITIPKGSEKPAMAKASPNFEPIVVSKVIENPEKIIAANTKSVEEEEEEKEEDIEEND